MPRMANDKATAMVREVVRDFIGQKSWFYQQQIDPYLPEMATYFINEITKRGVSLQVAEPLKKQQAARNVKPSARKPK